MSGGNYGCSGGFGGHFNTHLRTKFVFLLSHPYWDFPIALRALLCPQLSLEGLVPLSWVIIKSCPAGIMDVLLGLAAIVIHTYELNLFFYFPTPLGLSNNSSCFDMSPIICG